MRRCGEGLFRRARTTAVHTEEQRMVRRGPHSGGIQIGGADGRQAFQTPRRQVRQRHRHTQDGRKTRRHSQDLFREEDHEKARRLQLRPHPEDAHRRRTRSLLRHRGGQSHGVGETLPHSLRRLGLLHRGSPQHRRHLRQQPQDTPCQTRRLRPHIHTVGGVHVLRAQAALLDVARRHTDRRRRRHKGCGGPQIARQSQTGERGVLPHRTGRIRGNRGRFGHRQVHSAGLS